jgi:hypothetical protein
MGTVYTNEVTLTVTAAGPTIDTQPQNTTVDENTTATFTIGATGTGTLSYQWKKDGVPVGTNSTTYAFTAVEGDTGAVITCEVTDDVGTTVSDNATLTVTALFPTITVQPQSQTVDELDDVTFTVAATASAGTLSYQWYRNGGPVGTSTNSYTYQALLVDDADTVYCDVSDSNGTTTSTTATLTVTDLVLTIDTQPASIDEAPALNTVSFFVAYTSSYPASVQWYKDGVAVVGEIADTYSFVLQDTDEGSEIYATVTSAVDEQTTNTATIGFVLAPVTDLTYTVVKSDYRKPISKRGYVVLNRPLEEGESLSIERVTNVDNDVPAVEGEAFVSEGWEYQLDRFTLRLQEIEAHACDCSEEDTFPEGPPVVVPPLAGCEPYACDAFETALSVAAPYVWNGDHGIVLELPAEQGAVTMRVRNAGNTNPTGPVASDVGVCSGGAFRANIFGWPTTASGDFPVEFAGQRTLSMAGIFKENSSNVANGWVFRYFVRSSAQGDLPTWRIITDAGGGNITGVQLVYYTNTNQPFESVNNYTFATPLSVNDSFFWACGITDSDDGAGTQEFYCRVNEETFTFSNTDPLQSGNLARTFAEMPAGDPGDMVVMGWATEPMTTETLDDLYLAYQRNFSAYTPPAECLTACEPYDCSAFENYVLTQSDADFYGIFSNNKPDATSYLYNYNTVTAQNFSLESSIGATTQYDTPVNRIAVCYDGAFYRQTNEHNYPVVPKSWTKDTYLSAGMVIISNAGNTGVKRMMGIKHGQNSGRFVVDYNYGTGDWTVDFSTGTDTMYAPISDGVPVLLYAAYDELTGDYFLRVNDTTQAGTVGVGAGSNFGTGTVDFTNAGDVTNNLDSTLIVAWIKEDDVDTSDLMYTEFLRSVEGYTVPANCGLDGSVGDPALVRDGLLSNRTYCYNSLVDYDNDTIVYVPNRNTTFEYSTDSGATWNTSNVAAADLISGVNNNTEWGNFVYTDGEWIVFVWQPSDRSWGVWNFGPDLSNAAPTFITRDGDSMGFTRGMSQGNDGVIRTNSRSYVDGTRWGYVYTTSGSTATQTTPVTGSSTDWWTSKMDFKSTTIATGPGAGGGGGISLEVGSYYNNSFEAETNDTSMVVTTNSTTAAFIPAPAEGGNNQLVSFYKFTTTDGTHTIQSFACGEQMVQARMIWAYGRFVMIARPYNQGDHLLYSTSLDGTTWTDIAEIALPNFCSQNPGAIPHFQIAEWNANRILIHYKNSTGFFSLISVTMSTAVEVGTPITYVPEWETQECNEFSCDSTANWLSTYTDGLATGANLLTGATAVGSTIAVAGELWPVGGTFATPTTPGVFADQCGTEYGVPADGGYLDMLAVSQPGTDRYTRGVIVNGLTTTYTPIFECTYTHSVPAGVICDGRWICTEGDYNFTMTVELKRKGDHFMQRVTVFSPDIPADDFSNTVFEREHTWVVGGPISLQVQYDFDSYSNASGSFAGPKVTLGIGDGFNSAAFVNGLLDTSRGSITINSMDLLKGSSGLQFSHAFRLDKLDEVDHTATNNTIGLALAVQQNDSGWILPDYCPTP